MSSIQCPSCKQIRPLKAWYPKFDKCPDCDYKPIKGERINLYNLSERTKELLKQRGALIK